jgi:hypothetical protein
MPITYANNEDGTGVTATIAGAGAGDTTDLFVQSLTGKMEDWQFLPAGSIVGNGTVVVPNLGARFFYGATAGVVEPVVFVLSTNANESATHNQCLIAVVARLKLIGLDGINNDDIVDKTLPTDRGTNFQLNGTTTIVVSPPGTEGQSDGAGTNVRDDIVYPVTITILRADNQSEVKRPQGLLWRQQINKAFRQQHLPGVPCVYRVRISPGPIVDQRAFWSGRYHSSFILRCTSREGRGI